MAVIEGGVSGLLGEVGLGAAIPSHVVTKPTPYGNLGHYRISRRLVPASTTLAGTLWTFRNPSASGILAIVTQIRLRTLQVAAPTAAIEDRFSVRIARSYTVADSTNSNSIAPASNMQELRTSMGASGIQVREASAAAGASGGTKTLDTDAIVTGSIWAMAAISASSGSTVEALLYKAEMGHGEHPLVLAADEGFYITNDNNMGTASGIVLFVDIAWSEATLF